MDPFKSLDFSTYRGVIYALLAAVCFSSKAIMVKLLYIEGLDSNLSLMLRMSFALPFFLYLSWKSYLKNEVETPITKANYFQLVLLGTLGYYLSSLFDFIGLQYISAGLERLIVFIYPTLVVILGVVFFKRKLKMPELIALGLTYIGIGLVFYKDILIVGGPVAVKGSIFVFMSTLTYASYLIGSEKLIPVFGVRKFTALAMSVSSVIVIFHGIVTTGSQIFYQSTRVYLVSTLMAIISTVLASIFLSEAIKNIGSGKTSIIGSIGPVGTIGLAYLFLGEKISLTEIWGTILIMTGVLWVSYKN